MHPRTIFIATSAVFLLTIYATNAARILFLFAGGNLSHKTGVWPYVYGLAERQHNITFISSHPKIPRAHPNIHDIAPEKLIQFSANAYDHDRFTQRNKWKHLELFTNYSTLTINSCKAQLEHAPSMELFKSAAGANEKNGKFDLVVINAIFGECGIIIAAYLNTPFIVFDTTTIIPWFYDIYGIPWQTYLVPDMTTSFNTYPLSFMDRIQNFWAYYKYQARPEPFNEGMEEIKQKYFPLASPEFQNKAFIDMERDTSLVLVNTDPTFDFARPLPPLFKYVGGMQCIEEIGELPKIFKVFMDGASDEHGVILIAFGTTIDLSKLPTYYLDIFLNMMKKFSKVRFIWRWSGNLPKNAPKNLLAAEWLPQKAILNHPKLRAFMTHCGVGSITEATCYGVPLIAVPLFADQDVNAYRIQIQEVGLTLEIKGLDQTRMDSTVEEILTNQKFKKNMMARSAILNDQPMKPVDTAIYWTEFALRHKNLSCLKTMGLNQPFYVRNMFDVFLVTTLVFILVPGILLCSILCIVKQTVNK